MPDISILGALVASIEQQDHGRATASEVHTVPRTIVDTHLVDCPTYVLPVTKVAHLSALDSRKDSSFHLGVPEIVDHSMKSLDWITVNMHALYTIIYI